MRRIFRGLTALTALIVLVVGVPAALAFLGGNPAAGFGQGLDWWQVLTRPVNDQVIVGAVTIFGWLVWVAFMASLISEAINLLPSRRKLRPIRLPGLHVGQHAAAALILAVVALIAAPQLGGLAPAAHAEPTSPTPAQTASAPQHVTPIDTSKDATEKTTQKVQAVEAKGPQTLTHTVKAGDWLWTLAERYYDGDGSKWTKIATANPGIDPDELAIGQKLDIPDVAPEPSADPAGAPARKKAASKHTVTVGESLSSIAEDAYGEPEKWPRIYRANTDQLTDPDQIDVGQQLTVPGTKPAATSPEAKEKAEEKKEARQRDADRADAEQQARADAEADARQHERAQGQADEAHSQAQHERIQAVDDAAASSSPAQGPAAAPSATAGQPRTGVEDPRQQIGQAQSVDSAAGPSDKAIAAASVSVGLLLAAGLVSGLGLRRRRQQQRRQPGQMLPSPSLEAVHTEDLIRAQAHPMTVEDLDRVLSYVGGHCHDHTQPVPELAAARVADTDIHLLLAAPVPAGWDCPPHLQLLHDRSVLAVDADAIAAIDARPDMAPPYPALVTLGRDEADAHILINLESASALVLSAPDPAASTAAMTSLALELCLSPWSHDLQLTFVGPVCDGLAAALDSPNVTSVADTDRALTALENLADTREQHASDGDSPATRRGDHNVADAWNPAVLLFGDDLSTTQAARLEKVVTRLPRLAVAAITTTAVDIVGAWHCDLDDTGVTVTPQGWHLTPTPVDQDVYAHILELLTVTDTTATSPAPWWAHADDSEATITDLSTRRPTTVGGGTPGEHGDVGDDPDHDLKLVDTVEPDQAADSSEDAADQDAAAATDGELAPGELEDRVPVSVQHRPLVGLGLFDDGDLLDAPSAADLIGDGPILLAAPSERGAYVGELDGPAGASVGPPWLQILGECTIVGGAAAPARYPSRCMEFMLYLLEHPGTSTQTLSQVYSLGRGTTRQILASLRAALGSDTDGDDALWLPENYSRQGYRFDPRVSTDWHRVQRLIGRGVNTATDQALTQALAMVNGRPLTGADFWEAIEALRPVITSTLVDIAHELTQRKLDAGDISSARWATSKGLHADPRNELLLADRIRTESFAGNSVEVRRLASTVSANARELGVDLLADTQEVLADAALL